MHALIPLLYVTLTLALFSQAAPISEAEYLDVDVRALKVPKLGGQKPKPPPAKPPPSPPPKGTPAAPAKTSGLVSTCNCIPQFCVL
jgi:hypothetical protein